MDNRIRTAAVTTAVGCAVLVGASLASQFEIAAISKVVASCGFLAVAVFGGALRSTYGKVLLAGLVMSFFGDAFLIGESRGAFLAGLSAFLVAHIAYVGAFVLHGINYRWLLIAAIPMAGLAFGVSAWLAPHTPPDLALPVMLYTIVISAMLLCAVSTKSLGGSWLIVVGGLMFVLSDLSVASLRLIQTDFPTYVWGLPLYYGGQLCLAFSVSQSRSH